MPKFFVKQEQIIENKINIIGQDVNHIKNVLRLKENDEIDICNIDKEETYKCKIEKIDNESIVCNILEKEKVQKEASIDITIFQGLPKADKMELIIEKCTELGVKEITPVSLKRCVVKLDEKDKVKKIVRWQKIAETAAKQSGRDAILKVNNVINIDNVCNLIPKYDIVLVAYEDEKDNSLKQELENLKKTSKHELKIGVIIGPEGGLEKDEVDILKQAGAKIVTLGRRILRTETASIVIASILMYEFDEMKI